MLRIDSTSVVPIFRQIVDGLTSAIAAGTYRPGDLIPSVRQQSLTLLVNPNTVQRAYESLERAGLIETRKGIGMVVTTAAPTIAARDAGAAVVESLTRAIESATAAGLSREAIDAHFKAAWDAASVPSSSKRGKS